MRTNYRAYRNKTTKWYLMAMAVLFSVFLLQSEIHAFTLNVVDGNGSAITGGFRWLVEEDTTYPVTPGVKVSDSLGVNVHKVHAPVVASGRSDTSMAVINVPGNKRYFVSVLPYWGYTMSGTTVSIGQGTVKVTVHAHPVPTAQITIFAFHDNAPINAAKDLPGEAGLPGFSVLIFDNLGKVSQDAFGNPLGTMYDMTCDANGTPGAGTNPCVDPNTGEYVITFKGDGVLKTCPSGDPAYDAANCVGLTEGEALARFMVPNKYGVQIVPPAGSGWILTGTLEGTQTNDAWVRAGEPRFQNELGVLNWWAFFGYVREVDLLSTLPNPNNRTTTITGQVVYVHDNHPPSASGLNPGKPVEECYVGINNLGGTDEQVYTKACGPEGTFTIPNVPPGVYQLVFWDLPILAIIDFRTLTIPDDPNLPATIDFGPVPVFAWFANYEGFVFYDVNENGFRDPGEGGIPNQTLNIRHPDGSIYQTTVTDTAGEFGFNEFFPFFRNMIVEVDFLRHKATGATVVVDNGGPVDPANPWSFGGKLNPQPQPDPNNPGGTLPYRTELGPVLLEAMQAFGGQTNVILWGKKDYPPGENGGITGIVYYATTRAENDPWLAAADPWEPGIPRVQVALYLDQNGDGIIDDLNGDGVPTLADADNYPLGWAEGGTKGPEDIDRNGNGLLDPGDAIQIVWTDSWDDNPPTGCVYTDPSYRPMINGQLMIDCAEGLRSYNQVRPGVFDGGYAFVSYFPGGIASGSQEVEGLPSDTYYIVQVALPAGYELVKEQDKNVEIGDTFIPFLLPPPCVGDNHTVPQYLSLQTDESGNPLPGIPQDALIEAPFAGRSRPLCDRKQVLLRDRQNAAADFFLLTQVPKAARIWGWVTNDLMLEFNPNSVNKGANLAPSWLPVAVKDYKGVELVRVYADEWGRFNALVPSTYTVSAPTPTGVSPHMLGIFANDPGPNILNPDPFYNPAYGQEFGESWDFWPAKTTHVDTIVIPVAAFTANRVPLGCDFHDQTPVISFVNGGNGPVLPASGGDITIQSVGTMTVANPNYDPSVSGSPPSVIRDYGFGAISGRVTLGDADLQILSWTQGTIVARVPQGTQTGQLMVTRGDSGRSTVMGVTVHVAPTGTVRNVNPGQSIQAAIDSAADGDLIVVAPGTYIENIFVYKDVKIQGWGAYSTIINSWGFLQDVNAQAAWMAKLEALTISGDIVFIAGQQPDFAFERGAGFTVAMNPTRYGNLLSGMIDGFTITGASETGGGIFMNAYAGIANGEGFRISNNKIYSNQGSLGGGIRVGTPSLVNDAALGTFNGSFNENIRIDHNQINQNGSLFGGGGAIAIYKGADNYSITDNWICGNTCLVYGGGILHFGLSPGGTIYKNKIINNESSDEGGGVMLSGELVPAGANPGTLTEGIGSVTIDSNLIKGNKANDDGGGIRTLLANGKDVQSNPTTPDNWYQVNILNNMVVNNASGDVGGGISLDDTARINIINNTIAHNDSTATGPDAFGGPIDEDYIPPGFTGILPPEAGEPGLIGGITSSVPQVAGIAANAHSTGLQDAFGNGLEQGFSDPALINNIIYKNRAFFWDATYGPFGGLRPDVTGLFGPVESPVFWDLAVYNTPAPQRLNPQYCVLTTLTDVPGAPPYPATNIEADPTFVAPYFNEYQATSMGAAFGNFVNYVFKPLPLSGDYRIWPASSALDTGTAVGPGGGNLTDEFPELLVDYEGQDRPKPGTAIDIGADEFYVIDSAPTAVIQISPSGLIFTTTPTYIWNASPGADWYYLWVNDSTGNKIQQWYTAAQVGCGSGTGNCSVTPAVPLAIGAGMWWVQTWNTIGYGPWSSGMSFTVSPPGAAVQVSPSGSILTTTPTYTWNAVESSTWYHLWVNDSTGNRINQWYTAADAGCPDGTGNCSVTPTTALAFGAGSWWVQTYNDAGVGPWSAGMAFTVYPVNQATLISPSGTIADGTPTYTWNAVAGATWYYLWVNDSTGNKIKQWYTAADAGCPDGTGNCSVTPTIELAVGAGAWYIQTYSPAGYGPWSAAMNFVLSYPLPGVATLVSPSGATADTTPTYTWNAVAGATWYYLWVNDSTGNKIKQWYTAANSGCPDGTGNCSVTPTTVLAMGVGSWWIQTYNGAGYGPWSPPLGFTIAP